ncbi:MAG: hypothetical protein FH758_06265 [Firmicutes bacterium]|nr:hypothetical protein [Bacillota bacterium]
MNKRTIISLLINLCILVAITSTAFAAEFIDVDNHWAKEQINAWADKGLAGGYSDGTFKPNDPITRAEFVALTNRVFNISSDKSVVNFKDVTAGNWYYSEVAAANQKGYIGGYPDNTFKPNNNISRQEAASILTRLLVLDATTDGLDQFKDANLIPTWSQGSVGAVVSNGLMSGYLDNTYRAKRNITRAEAVVTLDRAIKSGTSKETSVLKGKVTSDGSGYANAVVKVFKADSYEVIDEVKTDSNGNFEFDLNVGGYDLTATTNDKVAYLSDVVVTTNSASIELALEDAAILSGSLVDEDDDAIKDATILFTTNPTFVAETDNDGDYKAVVLPNRTYKVRVYEPGEENEEPVVVEDELEVAGAGEYNIEDLEAPFTVGGTSGGSGGGFSGGGGDGDVSDTLTLTEDYDGNNEILDKNVVIAKDGITLSNVTIERDLTINSEVDEFTADNVEVKGNIFVNGGSPNTIEFKDCNIGEITINKQGVSIKTSGGTSIAKATVTAENVSFGGEGTIDNLVVETSGKVTVSKEMTITKIIVKNKNATIEDKDGNVLNAPKLIKEIDDLSLLLNEEKIITLSNYFEDADNDIVDYVATSNLNVTISGDKLTITADKLGESTITILVADDDNLFYEYNFTVTVRKDIEIPVAHTLPELLDAMEATLLQLTIEEWNSLKAYESYLSATDLRNSLDDAGLLAPLEWVVGPNIRMDEAIAIIDILKGISEQIESKDISQKHDAIISNVTELKTKYNTQIDKIKSTEALKDVSQEDLYNYFIGLYNYIISNDNLDTSTLDNYEVSLYDAALIVLKNGSHPDLKGAAETAFNKAKNYFKENSNPLFGGIIDGITFDSLEGTNVKTIKDTVVNDTSENGSQDVKDLLTIFDELLELSKTFLEN